jgi:HPt (histidine-containing phosphotransfer) domain-containing protein
MTDLDRAPMTRPDGPPSQPTADRRANVGEYLLAMSHEIRAPLNAVIGMSGMLLDSDLGERSRQYAKSVHSAGESLAAILNDLLDLSRVTAGRLAVDPIAFDLRSTIEETASALTPRANDRGLGLRVDWRPELPRHVIGDPGRTRQVLGNLIGHAVNATSHGEVVVRVLPEGERAGVPTIRFVVEDTGIGIMPERLNRIFDDYVPVDASPYRSFGVTGLGLRLSADLVRRMGGEIGAESVPGKGSRFWFVLPMPSAEPRAVPAVGEGAARGGRALVVEADLASRGRYIEQIETAGWEFEFLDELASLPETLREAAAAGDPFDACFISDYAVRPLHMEVAVKIKAEAMIAKTALVMVTAVGSPGEGKKLWHAGFGAYLRKPVPFDEMRDTLAALTSLGPDGRGSALITRHSLAEARNAQAFAPDGIDEMLASLRPEGQDAAGQRGSEADGPIVEAPPLMTGPVFVPVFAAAPPLAVSWRPAPEASAAEPAPSLPEAPIASPSPAPLPPAPVSFTPLRQDLISFEAIAEAAANDVLERPVEFDPKQAEIAPADGLESAGAVLDEPPSQVEGFLGQDFGAPDAPAFVEPVDHLPPGAEIGAPWSAEPEGAEPVETREEEPELEEIVPVESATEPELIEIELAAPEQTTAIEEPAPSAEPIEPGPRVAIAEVTTAPAASAAQTPVAESAPSAELAMVSPQLLDQLATGGGFFTQYLVMTFVREVPSAIADLATATNRGDGTRIKAALASLKALSRFVGAERLADSCDRIEAAVDRGQLDEAAPLIGTLERGFVGARDALDAAASTGLPADIPAVGGAFLEQVGPGKDGPAKALAIRLIDTFNTDATARIAELREVVAKGDAEQAQRIAQTVKGMCGLVTAEPLAKLCALVEADARLKRIGQADRYLDHLYRELERVRSVLAAARG